MEDISRKTKIAKDVLSKLSSHILNDYKTNGEDGDKGRSVQSCCNFDEAKLKFDSVFGEKVMKILTQMYMLNLQRTDIIAPYRLRFDCTQTALGIGLKFQDSGLFLIKAHKNH